MGCLQIMVQRGTGAKYHLTLTNIRLNKAFSFGGRGLLDGILICTILFVFILS